MAIDWNSALATLTSTVRLLAALGDLDLGRALGRGR